MRILAEDTKSITEARADALILGVFEADMASSAETSLDEALGGVIAAMRDRKEVQGKAGEVVGIHTLGRVAASRVFVVGLGKREDFTPEAARRAAGRSEGHTSELQ